MTDAIEFLLWRKDQLRNRINASIYPGWSSWHEAHVLAYVENELKLVRALFAALDNEP